MPPRGVQKTTALFRGVPRGEGENRRTATANERRGRAVIGRYYKRGRRCPGTVSRTSDRAARGCAGEKPRASKAATRSDADISKAGEDSATKANKEKENDGDEEKQKEVAATKIQAAFRGHHARKSLRVSETSSERARTDEAPSESTKEQLQEEFPADDEDIRNAATKIQATFRGHMSRKEQATAAAKSAMNMVESATSKIEEKMQDAVHELEGIDLADPDLHKAATKIQASFRGHKVRQEVNIHSTADESKK